MKSPTILELQKQLGHLNLIVEEARQKEKKVKLDEIAEHVKQFDITEIELLRAAGFVKANRQRLRQSTTTRIAADRGREKVHAPGGSSTRTWMTI